MGKVAVAALAVLTALLQMPVWAQSSSRYPDRPVQMIIPSAPGGVTDITGRLIADRLSARLGQPFIVLNRPGANTIIGMVAIVKAAPDGYTIGLSNALGQALVPLLETVPFDPIKDLEPITLISRLGYVLLADTKRVKNTSVQSLIASAKANPNKLNYGTPNINTGARLLMEWLQQRAGIELLQIPFNGSTPMMNAFLSGELDLICDTPFLVGPHVNSGRLKVLATFTHTRLPAYPDAPAMNELYPGMELYGWLGLAGPARTPREIVDKLSTETRAYLKTPEVIKRLEDLGGGEIVGSTPREYADTVATDIKINKEILEKAKVNMK